MRIEQTELGGLFCRIVDALPDGKSPALGVVLCHGFGAPGDDLVPLGPELLRLEPELSQRVRFYFPQAPLSLDEFGVYGGRAWWMLNVAAMVEAVERGEIGTLRKAVPPGLDEARNLLLGLLHAVCETDGLETSRLVLGGFSQGSMLATDVALRVPVRPAGLCIFSGTLLCEDEWRRLAAQRGRLPVLQSHGRQDQILPYEASVWLRDVLQESGLPVEFLPFDGPHTISGQALERFATFLAEILAE